VVTDPTNPLPYDLLMAIQQGTMDYQYRGVATLKNPFDLAIYPLLLAEARPKTLIEIGSHLGGSALWFADQAERLDTPLKVVSVDIAPPSLDDRRLSFLKGDARDLGAVLTDDLLTRLPRPWLVIEDADHSRTTTRAVLDFFDRKLELGERLVVEDGILTDMGVAAAYDGGPHQAVMEFLSETSGRYEIERRYCDIFGRNMTWNVDGYLRRVR
jgi:cephalosporin hydroxylase